MDSSCALTLFQKGDMHDQIRAVGMMTRAMTTEHSLPSIHGALQVIDCNRGAIAIHYACRRSYFRSRGIDTISASVHTWLQGICGRVNLIICGSYLGLYQCSSNLSRQRCWRIVLQSIEIIIIIPTIILPIQCCRWPNTRLDNALILLFSTSNEC